MSIKVCDEAAPSSGHRLPHEWYQNGCENEGKWGFGQANISSELSLGVNQLNEGL